MTFRSSFGPLLPPSTAALVAVLVLLVVAVPAFAALVAARNRAVDDDSPRRKRARYARTMLILWTMAALGYYALALHGETPADVGVRAPENVLWYAIGPLVVALLLSASGAGRGDISADYARAIRSVVPHTGAEWIWFVPLAATAAICEEFLYRGYALTQVAALTHSLTAGVVVSSLAFGLGHAYQGRIGMAGAAITGLAYAALFLFCGSLAPCVIAHFLQDIAGAALLSRRLYPVTAYSVGSSRPAGE